MNIPSPRKIKTPIRAIADRKPRSLALAERGITNWPQYVSLMSAIAEDVVNGDLTPREANAMTNSAEQHMKRQLLARLFPNAD